MTAAATLPPLPAGVLRQAVTDEAAIASNVAALRGVLDVRHLMVVVKADGYGHGLVPAARAALTGGADWLGVADVDEALTLRSAGVMAPVLAWLHGPGSDFPAAAAAGIDLALSSLAQLDAAAKAARAAAGGRAGVQLALDTGLNRNGAPREAWAALFRRAAELEAAGLVRVRGILSHVSNTSEADDLAQLALFREAVGRARGVGLRPELLHLAATAAALTLPPTRLTMVRIGIAAYGLTPFEAGFDDLGASTAGGGPPGAGTDDPFTRLGLTPALTLRAPVVAVRRVAAGEGVSYGYTYRTAGPTSLALIPLGYADGIPRSASNRGVVTVGGVRYPQVGRIAMDQFIIEAGGRDPAVRVGDEAIVFGDPARGAVGVGEWARAAGTIGYEIVTRLGRRVGRTSVGGAA
ncbi:MAG TPA: alanine racemase [Microbacteriaceae bacterium]|nr:alanine racemase [Microbacteriaceae bacterium]